MSKPKVLFLGCNHDQVPYLKTLMDRGYEVIGTDMSMNAPGVSLCTRFHLIGYDDGPALIRMGEEEHFSAEDRVFTAAAQFAHRGAAIFCEYFGIPYPSPATIDLCLDKVAYYTYFLEQGIPLPATWFVENADRLRRLLGERGAHQGYYLKSDYSKNPNYVYTFQGDAVPWERFFWGRDRYLRNHYILQETFPGISLRINVYGKRFNVFDFTRQELTKDYHEGLAGLGVINTLRRFMSEQGLAGWLVKFDVILGDKDYAVLDIGLDPPYRMVREAERRGIPFARHYLDQYLDGRIDYPPELDG